MEHGSTVPKSCILSSTPDPYKWCGEVLVDASTRAFLDNLLLDTKPTVIHDFLEFDKHVWMLLYSILLFLLR